MSELPSTDGVAKRLRDSVLENELSRLLRDASDAEREDFLVALLKCEQFGARMGALALVRRTVTNRKSLQKIFRVGLGRKDVSEINSWLRAVAPRLGVDSILSFLAKDDIKAAEIVRCWYYLMPYVTQNKVRTDAKLRQKIERLKTKVEANYGQLSNEEKNNWPGFANKDRNNN